VRAMPAAATAAIPPRSARSFTAPARRPARRPARAAPVARSVAPRTTACPGLRLPAPADRHARASASSSRSRPHRRGAGDRDPRRPQPFELVAHRHPAAVLVTLPPVELVEQVPLLVLRACRHDRPRCKLRIGAEERQTTEDEPRPSRPHVLRDESGQRPPRPLAAVRALQVAVLHDRDRLPSAAPCYGMPPKSEVRGGREGVRRPTAPTWLATIRAAASAAALPRTKTNRRRVLMGHRPLDVPDLQQTDLAEIDRGERMADERVWPLLLGCSSVLGMGALLDRFPASTSVGPDRRPSVATPIRLRLSTDGVSSSCGARLPA
jgi:hypothetical protein